MYSTRLFQMKALNKALSLNKDSLLNKVFIKDGLLNKDSKLFLNKDTKLLVLNNRKFLQSNDSILWINYNNSHDKLPRVYLVPLFYLGLQ